MISNGERSEQKLGEIEMKNGKRCGYLSINQNW